MFPLYRFQTKAQENPKGILLRNLYGTLPLRVQNLGVDRDGPDVAVVAGIAAGR